MSSSGGSMRAVSSEDGGAVAVAAAASVAVSVARPPAPTHEGRRRHTSTGSGGGGGGGGGGSGGGGASCAAAAAANHHDPAHRRRTLLSAVISRLEAELRARQQQLVEEAARNAVARARIPLIGAFAEAYAATQLALAAAGVPAVPGGAPHHSGSGGGSTDALEASLRRLDELLASVHAALHDPRPATARGSDSGGAGGGAAAGAGTSPAGSPPPPLASGPDAAAADSPQLGLGVAASELIRRVAAAAAAASADGALDGGRAAFAARWRDGVQRLAALQAEAEVRDCVRTRRWAAYAASLANSNSFLSLPILLRCKPMSTPSTHPTQTQTP